MLFFLKTFDSFYSKLKDNSVKEESAISLKR